MCNLKLKEILWEITPQCNKDCDYCGSKAIKNKKPLKRSRLEKIAQEIEAYGVNEVVLTGGEPGTLIADDPDTLVAVLGKFQNTKVKVVTNGLFVEEARKHKRIKRMKKIFRVGISVNNLNDIEYVKSIIGSRQQHTMITNFGTHNIWDADALYDFAVENFGLWQVQLTMGKYQLNAGGIKYIRDKLKVYDNVVLADNLQEHHNCLAGIQSCGILYNGAVVACLSERAYGPDKIRVYGSLLENELDDIWENGFKDVRFGNTRKCCRDYIHYPVCDPQECEKQKEPATSPHHQPVTIPTNPRPYQPFGQLIVYGVVGPRNTPTC